MTWQLLVEVEPAIGHTLASLAASHVEAPVTTVPMSATAKSDGVILVFETAPKLSLIDALSVWLANFGVSDAALHSREGADDPWQPGWLAMYDGLSLSPRIWVTAAGRPAALAPQLTVWLHPGGAFGSGHHPSTRVAMVLLEEAMYSHGNASVLDCGCGSGLLAIAAILLGASQTLGVDIDAHAVTVAEQHAKLNAVADRCSWQHGQLGDLQGRWDLVIANMPPGILCELGQDFAHHVGRGLIVAGFEERTAAEVERSMPWARVARRVSLDGWSATWLVPRTPS